MNKKITIWITSCWRYKLLKKTIISLWKNINLSEYKKIITEDSTKKSHIKKIIKENKNWFLKWWDLIYTSWSKQQWALEKLYKNINTPYIFHCEDDWFFKKVDFNFFDISINLLEKNKNIWIVQLRDFKKDWWLKLLDKEENERYNELFSNEKIVENNLEFIYFRNDEKWDLCKGFSYNPWMRRTEEMKKIMFWYENYVDEFAIWTRFKNLWLRWVNLKNWIIIHIWNSFLSTRFKSLFDEWFIIWIKKVIIWTIKYRVWLLSKYLRKW